jgi:uncharacterized protein YjdB
MQTHYLTYRFRILKTLTLISLLVILTQRSGWSQTIPYTFNNNSGYADNTIYVGMVGIINGSHVWLDCKTSTVKTMNTSDNTVTGPVYSGNMGPGGNAMYANCFTRLSDIPNKTINIPKIGGCRIFISFNSQLYLYFFGATGGYAAPNLANTTDPNQNVRFEIIELTYADNGLWTNTTRVDNYQFPMGLEVWGNSSFYKKVGELKSHAQIISQWKSTAPSEFQVCLNTSKEIIQFPSKVSSFSANYFQAYVDAIWSKYAGTDLLFNSGDAGVWKGRVSGSAFVFTRVSDGQVATISNKPTNLEAMEGSGVMASGGQWDKVVQAQVCAAINRHAIDLNAVAGTTQNWGDETKYYITSPYNWYCGFWHQADISYNKLTYAFCYDDVFDKSSTINCPSPTKAVVTIGGFYGLNNVLVTGVSLNATSVSLPTGATSQLTATVAPSNATNQSVSWSSGNTTVATVNSSGLVKGVAAGTATIAVTTQDGAKTAACVVTVTASNNLALNKAVAVSSTETVTTPGSAAVDGNTATRWSSAFSDPQWIYVDLGANYNINRVKITWEAAYAAAYQIQVSSDATNWTTLKTITGNTSLLNDNTGLSGTGRYVRMYGTARGTSYGYSIYELEVYGTLTSRCTIANAGGDYSVSISNDAANPSVTFIPSRTGVGSPTCILFYSTSPTGTYPGYNVTPNTAYKITAAAGSTVYFYYTYSVPEGGEKNTQAYKNSFTVGNCSTLKQGVVVTDIANDNDALFEAYPIPLTDVLTIKYCKNCYQKIVISDITGKAMMVKTIEPGSAIMEINVSQLKPGIYFLNLVGENVKTGRMIVK